ncbi:PEP-CTERM sorting domain-containing protein [Paludisphaera sp.]|uniref:PEP-CTERM sorting domain-containing protein n=1 Tax=Paludisphaera sp. TaxID=2017432 RepID=UPI00301BE012
MKLGKVLFATALALTLGLGSSANADSIGFNASEITADGDPLGPIDGATVFTFATDLFGPDTQVTVDNPTGIFASIAEGTEIASSVLDLAAAGGEADPYLTLTLNQYSFLATGLISDLFENNGRLITFTGVINGPPGFDPLAAEFVISFTQAGGPGNTISYSGTLATAVIPEPTSVAMLAIGGLGLAFAARRRRAL